RPVGSIGNGDSTYELATTDQLFKADDYRKLIVTYRNGSAVRVGDVADVSDSVQDRRNAGLANGKSAVLIILFRQPAANMIET
ncbi:efflux RND transporter permease subunit, partial [Escherichia coli]|uniref:efflux RND transporter permease subunit n=1 Tax=Escherichia coli TaxID=562 RepID=UPI003F47FFE6